MLIASIILGVVGIGGFVLGISSLVQLSKDTGRKFRRVSRDETTRSASNSLTGFERSVRREKSEGYEMEVSFGLTPQAIREGYHTDPQVRLMTRVFVGFAMGIFGVLSSIGSGMLAAGNHEGWFLIGVVVFFFSFFLYQYIRGSRNNGQS